MNTDCTNISIINWKLVKFLHFMRDLCPGLLKNNMKNDKPFRVGFVNVVVKSEIM